MCILSSFCLFEYLKRNVITPSNEKNCFLIFGNFVIRFFAIDLINIFFLEVFTEHVHVSDQQFGHKHQKVVLLQLGLTGNVLQPSKVLLNLLLGGPGHAGAHGASLVALNERLELGHVDVDVVAVVAAVVVVVLNLGLGGQRLGDQVADTQVLDHAGPEPRVGHVEVIQGATLEAKIKLVVAVEDLHLAHDAGHVANGCLALLVHLLEPLLELVAVTDVCGKGGGTACRSAVVAGLARHATPLASLQSLSLLNFN